MVSWGETMTPLKWLAAALIVLAAGCATEPSLQEGDSARPGWESATVPDASARPRPSLREVPNLQVLTDCGACQVKDSVPALIVEGYASAAAERGAKPGSDPAVTVSIKQYSARDTAARFVFGVLAGRDEIKAAVSFEGRQFVVEDYYANAWLGIDDLARKIGEMVFERVNQLAGAGAVTPGQPQAAPGQSQVDDPSGRPYRRTRGRWGKTRL
jgi:hypothetical protein